MQLPTNKTFKVRRDGGYPPELVNLNAMCLPLRDEIAAIREIPAAKVFGITFDGPVDVREQDVLVNQLEADEEFRVRGIKKHKTPYLAHTYAIAEGRWGTD